MWGVRWKMKIKKMPANLHFSFLQAIQVLRHQIYVLSMVELVVNTLTMFLLLNSLYKRLNKNVFQSNSR